MRLVVVVVLLAAALAACDEDPGGARQLPTEHPTVAATPPAGAGYVLPAIDAPAPSLDGCPVDDGALCRLALDLREAVASGELDLVERRLVAEARDCAGTFALSGRDIGCASEAGTSDPVVAFFNYGSDCCFVTPDEFVPLLRVALGAPMDDTWRVAGIVRGSPFWDGSPSVLLIRGAPEDRQVIEFGTSGGEDPMLRGAITGSVGTLYIFPQAELLPWR